MREVFFPQEHIHGTNIDLLTDSKEGNCLIISEVRDRPSLILTTTDLTTSTAPALTFGSLPMIDTLAVNEPSMENTTVSVLGGRMAR